MGQHLYRCERCPAIGVAHYLLVAGRLVRVCTACWKRAKKDGHRDTAAPEEVTR